MRRGTTTHLGTRIVGAALCMSSGAVSSMAAVYQPNTVHDVDLLANGNLLVTDGGTLVDPTTSGIYEIDRDGNIVWSYTTGLSFAHNADKQPNGDVIISDTLNNRVIIVNQAGTIIWNSDAVPLSDGSSLDYPNDANLLPSGNFLITDRNNHRVLEIDAAGTVVWQFGITGVPGAGAFGLRSPHNADRLANGNTIIADSINARIIEVDPGGAVVWSYAGGLALPRDADRLPDGNTLINDTNNLRIIEVTPAGATVWSYTVTEKSYDSDRLDSGNTLMSVQDAILEVDPAGTIVWSYPTVYATEIIEGYLVTAPNGNLLWTRIIQPREDLYPGQAFPAIVNTPGGLGSGETGDQRVAARGFVEFHFNAEGRGLLHPSQGVEDFNGFIHQDDLKAVIEFARTRPNVIDDNLGVVTGSYGITMGAGCLGRYPQLQVKYLIDREGPSESYVTCFEPWSLDADPSNDRIDQGYAIFGHYSIARDPSPENVAWWSEREATRYIGRMRCRYLRMQAEWDHAQPPNAQWPGFDYYPLWWQNKHAIDLVNLATLGQSPWTLVNGLPLGNAVNSTYGYGNAPFYYTGRMADHPGELIRVVQEMAAMPPLVPGDFDADGDVDLTDYSVFADCVTGPAGGPLGAGCGAGDFDADNDVDLEDFGAFQPAFNGL